MMGSILYEGSPGRLKIMSLSESAADAGRASMRALRSRAAPRVNECFTIIDPLCKDFLWPGHTKLYYTPLRRICQGGMSNRSVEGRGRTMKFTE